MRVTVRTIVIAALFLASVCPGTGHSTGPLAPVGAADASTAGLSPRERGQLTRQFVLKWGPEVQRLYGTPIDVWATRMVRTFVAADSANFRAALKRTSLDGALATLNGSGHRVADPLASGRTASGKAATAGMLAAKLGDTTGDLSYTAVTPCRVVDTRVAGGPITANNSRSFLAVAVSAGTGFAFQGGSSTDCNVAAVGASAVALNVTAVAPSGAGYATVYRSGDTRPLAASVNYAAGAIVNNTVVVGIPNPLTITDFSIYTFAQSHYVVDVVGYFSPPQATPLDCVNTSITTSTIAANSTNFFNNPACPTGYKATETYCWTAAAGVRSQGDGYNANSASNATFCAWENNTASNQSVYGGNVCCRIPGR